MFPLKIVMSRVIISIIISCLLLKSFKFKNRPKLGIYIIVELAKIITRNGGGRIKLDNFESGQAYSHPTRCAIYNGQWTVSTEHPTFIVPTYIYHII